MNRSMGEIAARARARTRNEQIGKFYWDVRDAQIRLVKTNLCLIGISHLPSPFILQKKGQPQQLRLVQPIFVTETD